MIKAGVEIGIKQATHKLYQYRIGTHICPIFVCLSAAVKQLGDPLGNSVVWWESKFTAPAIYPLGQHCVWHGRLNCMEPSSASLDF